MSGQAEILLPSDHWASQSVGYLVVEILAGLALTGCLVSVRFFKWTVGGRRDTTRTVLFVVSTVSMIIYFILDLTNEGESEQGALESYRYFVLYIITALFSQISEYTLLLVVAPTVNLLAFANPAANRPVRWSTFSLLVIVGAVSTTLFGLYAGYYGSLANYNYSAYSLVPATVGFIVAYETVYLALSLYILAAAIIAVLRQRSKASLIMLLVAISLLLRTLLSLVDVVIDYYTGPVGESSNVNWAASFVYDIMTAGIYLGVAAIAVIGSYRDSMLKDDTPIELAPFAKPHVYE